MKPLLTGRNAKVYVRIDGVFKLVLCATDATLQYDHEEILETSRNSGKFIERDTRLCDWGINVTGLTRIDNADGQASFLWLMQQGVRGSKQYMKFELTDNAGNTNSVTGWVLVKQGTLAAAVAGFSTVTQFFPGTGAYVIGDVDDFAPTDLFKLYLSTTPGANEVSDNNLGGATEIMLVGREDGMAWKEVTGTPSGRQFKFTDYTTYGTLTFASDLVFNPGEIVYVQFKKPI